jgi:hypothetical protein
LVQFRPDQFRGEDIPRSDGWPNLTRTLWVADIVKLIKAMENQESIKL